jgi:hypothetical protein
MNVNFFFLKTVTLLTIAFCAFSCGDSGNADDPYFIDLADGFYYLNGTDEAYQVRRNVQNGGNYVLNPEPIFSSEDYESIEIIEEENGRFSLSVQVAPLKMYKWEKALNSSVHYIGFVYGNRLGTLLQIKGENARDDVYLYCVGNTEEEAEMVKERLVGKN